MTNLERKLPQIIQGGMGLGISSWRLARSVSLAGELGVISGTALDALLTRRLQEGDEGGHMQRAMEAFPFPEIAERVFEEYHLPLGKPKDKPYKRSPMYAVKNKTSLLELAVLANFVEVYLAKEGHDKPVGVNYLEKIQMPHISALYGAMLAGVDYVLMGAGIPRQIPGILDSLSQHEAVSYKLHVDNASKGVDVQKHFNPKTIGNLSAELLRPEFLAIVSSSVLALTLARKASGKVNGFIVEGPTAGGHNASPRVGNVFNIRGEPTYGLKDFVDLEKIAELGVPYWLAGGYGRPDQLRDAQTQGAAGIQVGTLFSLCDESDLHTKIKKELLKRLLTEDLDIFTDAKASPTGFPFKVISHEGTLSEQDVYEQRKRICDLGYLRTLYEMPDGKLVLRCSSAPVQGYLSKGGELEDTVGKKCLCNALFANLGLGQVQNDGLVETPLLTAGNDINFVKNFFKEGKTNYSAKDVIDYLRGDFVPTLNR